MAGVGCGGEAKLACWGIRKVSSTRYQQGNGLIFFIYLIFLRLSTTNRIQVFGSCLMSL